MLFYTIMLLVAVAALAGVALLVHTHLNGGSIGSTLFGPKPERRLGVMEQTSVDSRRRLILVRRDNVEHLIMTGGPVDVVIETGIGATKPRVAAIEATDSPPVFARAPRTKAQAVNE